MLIFFGLVLTAVILEIGLRVVTALRSESEEPFAAWGAEQTPTKEYWAIYDPDLGYRQNPKFPEMNPDGLRDYPIAPKNEKFRLLFLGDSVAVYGDSVDDTFVGHVRAALQKQPAYSSIEVLNAGIKGYTNYQEVLYLKKYGLAFAPDLVGFEFCFNDLFKFLHSFEVKDGQLVAGTYNFSTEAVDSGSSWWRNLARQSHLLVWLKDNVGIARDVAQWRASGGFSFDYRRDIRNAWQDAPWQEIEVQFREALEMGRQHDFRVFVVAFPLAVQYDPDYLARDRDYVLKPQRKLRAICERLGIPFYDLYPQMTAEHFLDDAVHLTGPGRQIAGERIADFLRDAGLIKEADDTGKLQDVSGR